MRWFKFYGQDWLTDLKIRRLSTEDRLCFITLLCLASTADEKGLVRGCDEQTLIEMTNLRQNPYDENSEYNRAVGCLERYAALQIVTLHDNGDVTVNNFERRQGENLSNAERQKNYRERLKTKPKQRNARNVTRYNDSNARIEENRIEENRERVYVARSSFGESRMVKLSQDEYDRLVSQLNQNAVDQLIIELDQYIASTGKTYKSHYATIQAWARRRIQEHATMVAKTKTKVI
jgi:hypothetical protein